MILKFNNSTETRNNTIYKYSSNVFLIFEISDKNTNPISHRMNKNSCYYLKSNDSCYLAEFPSGRPAVRVASNQRNHRPGERRTQSATSSRPWRIEHRSHRARRRLLFAYHARARRTNGRSAGGSKCPLLCLLLLYK